MQDSICLLYTSFYQLQKGWLSCSPDTKYTDSERFVTWVFGNISNNIFNAVIFKSFFEFFSKFSNIIDDAVPVSYTHLDVYKRQN